MTKKTSDIVISVLFLLPSVVLFALFIVYPVFNTFYLSFHSWKGIYVSPKIFIGLTNYSNVLTSRSFWNSMLNIFYFALGGFLILMPLAFCLALLITSELRGTRIMKAAFFMPVMLSTTAVALMWVYILNPSFGILSQIGSALNWKFLKTDFLSTPGLNVWSVVLVNEWMYAGYNMLIFSASLVAIPQELYESAEIDGCTGFGRIVHISIPLSKEAFKIFSILCITGCLKVFDIIWAMTRGGPNHTSDSPATYLYNEAFTFKFFGKSSAIAVILLILGISLSLLVNRFFTGKDET
ncbi:MAG: sugar ABC transporter permease [Treponema sp.]|jgi:raffinose/stachyose/melibiose transport system permease protein|nr:sugar ABC transporter permease [Treponema sp.]